MPQEVSFRRAPFPLASPPVALTLVSASYSGPMMVLLLSFDRAVDIAAFDGSQIVVNVPADDLLLQGAGATLNDPVSVLVTMTEIGSAAGGALVMTATELSGIVAVDDGGTWAGVTDLPLP